MIELKKITHKNYEAVLDLKVAESQKSYVASNMYCLALAYVDLANGEQPISLAIYADETVVGFILLKLVPENSEGEACYDFFCFMIDEEYQGKGYGKEAFAKIINYLKTFPQGFAAAIRLSYDPENQVARKLYQSFGFVETGKASDGETIARLGL